VSACTTGGGRVFAAAVDQHRVCALDMADGRLIWDYTAGGRVDTPPTIHEGLVLFGAADGWVYCLRAADGKLAWRFRAAPQERRIVAFGQVESPWPVHGAVLVKDGLACVAAGRSTHLDGGIHVYALKPRTGELIRELRPLNNQAEGLEDVLVSDGNLIYMRQLQFSLSGEGGGARGEASQPAWLAFHAFSTAGLLDPSYFSRVGWSTGAKGGGSELLIFDELSTYSFRTRRSGGFGGWFQPGTGAYGLAALDRKLQKPRWSQAIPVRVRAMVAAGETLFVAGPPDLADPKDPLGAFEDRKGAQLWAFAASDGQKLVDYRLESPPVFDGMAAAAGRLFLATTDGKVVCLGKP
jgi:outer membrane protein assembly factor BamB